MRTRICRTLMDCAPLAVLALSPASLDAVAFPPFAPPPFAALPVSDFLPSSFFLPAIVAAFESLGRRVCGEGEGGDVVSFSDMPTVT